MADTRTASAPVTNDILAQVVDRVQAGSNVLVALSNSPSVDEMAAAVGLTLVLDKLGKHATAIFSGKVPNALEFLKPEETFEQNTNSLQDFIIALNKEKADHLRYKIEGDYVKIFITPYRTTINENDLEFSHGDFNVDLVIAMNVSSPAELDGAMSEHGRIMHNASAINMTAGVPGQFGDLEWNNPAASSISEMVGMLVERFDDGQNNLLDAQVATAILTGIVAATERFRNERTTPDTMVMASRLMARGADQKLIATNIEVGSKSVAVEGAEAIEGIEGDATKPDELQDSSMLTIDRDAMSKVTTEEPPPATEELHGAVDFTPTKPPPIANEAQALEKVIQPPAGEGMLLEELRAAGSEMEAGELRDNAPKKDYSALIEQELKTPIGEEVPVLATVPDVPPVANVGAVGNLAAQAAPAIANTPEVNGVPVINYGQVSENVPAMTAPTGGEQGYINAAPPLVVTPPAAMPAAPAVDVPMASPLPMPNGTALPPPPPPFDPNAGLVAPTSVEVVQPAVMVPVPTAVPVAVPVQPVQPVMQQPMAGQVAGAVPVPATAPAAPVQPVMQPAVQPVMPEVVPIQPAMPDNEHMYLGSDQAMPDQVYPKDPGAFQLPR